MRYLKYIVTLFIPIILGISLTSCQEDDLVNNGKPVIYYIRVTDPAEADVALDSAYMGNLIAIVGDNLGDVREIWFNDQSAILNPAFISDQSILVTTPNTPPAEVTDELTLKFGNGGELTHSFSISISAPRVDVLKNEYAPVGTPLTIKGDFFFDPLVVTFEGGVEAEVVSLAQSELTVIVPEGAAPGAVTVETNFGTATSSQMYYDTRNVFADFEDEPSGWWHGHLFIVDQDPDVDPISGRFIRVNQEYAGWFEMLVAPANSSLATGNIPADAIQNPQKYNLKFELNTVTPWADQTVLKFFIGNEIEPDRHSQNYAWASGAIDTKGKWETMSIPFEYIMANSAANPNTNEGKYAVSFFFNEGVSQTLNFAVDNFRVTPK
ncbi:glycan-binding surface protein [Limibacter armeniacum]|uniref:glycan-binding surface protein n=1 Tax=Limibacter armeniacum TaxID=466084 RepID=UPI002FE6A7CB